MATTLQTDVSVATYDVISELVLAAAWHGFKVLPWCRVESLQGMPTSTKTFLKEVLPSISGTATRVSEDSAVSETAMSLSRVQITASFTAFRYDITRQAELNNLFQEGINTRFIEVATKMITGQADHDVCALFS